MTRYDALNAAKRDRGLFELGRGDRRAAIRNINEVRDAVRAEINHIGAINPQALQNWNEGVNAFATIHQSRALTNSAQDFLRGPYGKPIGGPVGALFGAGIYKAPLVSGGVSAAAAGAHKVGQIGYRVWNNPTLARYYWDAMRDLSLNNKNGFISNYLKLQTAYDKKYGSETEKQK
jgi:hypothetical protein